MINAHSEIPMCKPEIFSRMKFWISNEWHHCCFGIHSHFQFTLFEYQQSDVMVLNEADSTFTCFIITLCNFAFVLRVRKE
jgi:hypothetical protein